MTLNDAHLALLKAGYSPIAVDDDQILLALSDNDQAEGDVSLTAVLALVESSGCTAEWTGESVTDEDGTVSFARVRFDGDEQTNMRALAQLVVSGTPPGWSTERECEWIAAAQQLAALVYGDEEGDR